MVIIEALIVGLAVGAILGLVGAGGAVLAVPAFLYLFNFTALQATTASLAVVAASAAFGAVPRFRLGQVRLRQATLFWLLGVAGTLAGSRIAPLIPDPVLITGFALVMVGAAIAMWRKGSHPEPVGSRSPSLWLTLVVATGIGLLAGVFGVGGGFLIVPALVLVFGFPFGVAAGTSLVIVSLNSLTALMFRVDTWHDIQWQLPLIVIVGGLVGSVVAARANLAISQQLLERAFAGLLVLLASWMVIEAIVMRAR